MSSDDLYVNCCGLSCVRRRRNLLVGATRSCCARNGAALVSSFKYFLMALPNFTLSFFKLLIEGCLNLMILCFCLFVGLQ